MMSNPGIPIPLVTVQTASSSSSPPPDSNQATGQDVGQTPLGEVGFGDQLVTPVPSTHDTRPPAVRSNSEANLRVPDTDDYESTSRSTVQYEREGRGIPLLLPTMACHRHAPDPPYPRRPGRNLVVCIDGTANQFGRKNSNVVEFYSRLPKHSEQLTYYNSGIGTYATPSLKSWSFYKQVIGHIVDMVFAWRYDRVLLDAYRWLSNNYHSGDRIFLFGFSRGAYQIRVLAGMIEKVGLIHKGNEAQIPLYVTDIISNSPGSDAQDLQRLATISALNGIQVSIHTYSRLPTNWILNFSGPSEHDGRVDMADRFKKTFCHANVVIHFVGAWDTVSSIGVKRRKVDLPLTALGMRHVCYFRHALALHERRVKFLPEYAQGGAGPIQEVKENKGTIGPPPEGVTVIPEQKFPRVKEVWFAGTHSDM
ncbi:hypothetical protein V5O48_012904 [Marasmius crinis-equi]|uniref:T6SS Phospholipase effector Tle1-like catalytic domain-containing protein n=1 Tax=Marasmius crinis-equi TaxID=585013 RepID=A0ABR3F1V4_9AGAR